MKKLRIVILGFGTYCVATPLRASAAPQQRRVVRPSPAVQR
jgi:hypothetical protein